MKKICFLFLLQSLIFNLQSAFAQVGEWVWIHGSSTAGSLGNTGAQGVPSLTNEPPSFYEPAEFADLNGKYWFYGGLENAGIENDLWRYDPASNEWTWISGTHTINDAGSYGVQGVPSSSNRPPGLAYGATTWTDLSGNLWIFGGNGSGGNYCDLWRYTIGNNEWTWMKGTGVGGDLGIYGTQGVPDTANHPPARAECSAAWTDNAGDLWFFGGLGTYNDLWRYTIATNTWTWMKGSNARDQQGQWGIKGVEDPANTPSARFAYTRWKDKSGNLWLYGGVGYDATGTNWDLGDLWRYNVLTNNWAWISGSDIGGTPSFYGTKCSTSSFNVPAGRVEDRAAWTDANGNFWMFGGFDQTSFSQSVSLNDLWMYCVTSNEWTWESGDSTTTAGNWGTLNVASPTNKPDGRVGALGWTDHNGHLYLFAGRSAAGDNNDLWEYTIDPNCGTNCPAIVSVPPPVASFQVNDSVFCSGNCIDFTDLTANNPTSWQWSFPGAIDSTSSAQNPSSVCYEASGIFNVTLIASNSGGSDTVTFSNYIHVSPTPPTPTITQVGTTLYCSTDPTYTSYQWYDTTALIPGATDTFLVVSESGDYNVQVSNTSGCKIAVGINIILGVQNYVGGNIISIYPNPAEKELIINNSEFRMTKAIVYIMNTLGQTVFQSQILNQQSQIDISSLPCGVYFVEVTNESGRWVGRFVKE